jgi:hypothetical protein
MAGGSEPHDPGATGSHPSPKHVTIHRFQFIEPENTNRKGRLKSKETDSSDKSMTEWMLLHEAVSIGSVAGKELALVVGLVVEVNGDEFLHKGPSAESTDS